MAQALRISNTQFLADALLKRLVLRLSIIHILLLPVFFPHSGLVTSLSRTWTLPLLNAWARPGVVGILAGLQLYICTGLCADEGDSAPTQLREAERSGVLCALRDSDPHVQDLALNLVRRFPFPEAHLQIKRFLDSSIHSLRLGAIHSIRELGIRGPGIEAKLRSYLSAPDPIERYAAAAAMKKTFNDPEPFLTLSRLMLNEEDEMSQCRVVHFLSIDEGLAIGSGTRASQLLPLLNHRFYGTTTIKVLGSIGPHDHQDVLRALCVHGDEKQREAALIALRRLGGHAADQLGDLLVSESDNIFYADLAWRLREMPRQAPRQAARVAQYLTHPEKQDRLQAIRALGLLQEQASEFTPVLAAYLRDPDPEIRKEAARALEWHGGYATPYLPDLIELMKTDEDQHVRATAAGAVGHVGLVASEVLPLLIEKIRNDRPDVKRSAAASVKHLSGLRQAARNDLPVIGLFW